MHRMFMSRGVRLSGSDSVFVGAARPVAEDWPLVVGSRRKIGINVLTLLPALGDFNDDLRRLGSYALAAGLRVQLRGDDAAGFLISHGDSQAA